MLIGIILQLPARAPLMLIPDSLSMRAAGGASLGLYGHARELRGELEEVVGVVPIWVRSKYVSTPAPIASGRRAPVGKPASENASANQ